MPHNKIARIIGINFCLFSSYCPNRLLSISQIASFFCLHKLVLNAMQPNQPTNHAAFTQYLYDRFSLMFLEFINRETHTELENAFLYQLVFQRLQNARPTIGSIIFFFVPSKPFLRSRLKSAGLLEDQQFKVYLKTFAGYP